MDTANLHLISSLVVTCVGFDFGGGVLLALNIFLGMPQLGKLKITV